MEGFSRLLGAHRGFEEALFSTLISADFLQNLPKFCSEDTRREPKDLWIPLRKSSENPPFALSLTSRQPNTQKTSPKIFSIFWGAYIRSTSKHTADPAMDFAGVLRGIPRYIFGESCGASSMNPNESCSAPFSRIFQRGSLLPPRPPASPASPKPKKCAAQSNYPSRCT